MEEQIVQAKESAEMANQAKGVALARLEENFRKLQSLEQLRDSLTHMIVHDMKSPLSSVGGLLGLFSEQTAKLLSADQNEYILECRRLVQRLQDMILSVLDVSRLENGQMPLNLEVYDVEQLARDAEQVVHADARAVTIRIVPPNVPLRVRCDADIVRRVIVNLLDNALKFTPAGGEIAIRMRAEGDWVRVTVADTGPGIPEQHHQRIFERFVSVEARRFSTGLGLTFCKLAVEAHGGTIGVESPAPQWQDRPGVIGTAFTFTLPQTA
jgi:two-component system sensor histidine kinase/response regulator